MSMGLIGKLFGFVSSLLTAYLFGANSKTDIIFFACLIIFTLGTLFSSYNSNILLPQLIRSEDQEKEKLVNYSFTLLFLSLSFVLIVLFSFHIEFLESLSNFKRAQLLDSKLAIILLLPILLLQPLNDMMINVAQSFKNYQLSNLSSLIVGISNVSCNLLFHDTLHENSLALGFLLAAITQSTLFYIYLYRRNLHPKFSFKKPLNSKLISSLLLPTLFLQILTSILIILPDFFASSLHGGTLSLMSYGKRIFDLIPTLFIYPIVLVFYPRICEWLYDKNTKVIQKNLYLLVRLFFVVLFPIATFFILYSNDLVLLFFSRGKLSIAQLEISSHCLILLTLSTPAFIVASFSGRLLAASQTKRIFYWQLFIQFCGALLLYALIFLNIDHYGYLAIVAGLFIFHFFYGQLTHLLLVQQHIFSFSIFRFLLVEINFCIIPLLIGSLSYCIKYYLPLTPNLNLLLSGGIFILLSLVYMSFYYFFHKNAIGELLKH